jgi:hypothetical protein
MLPDAVSVHSVLVVAEVSVDDCEKGP